MITVHDDAIIDRIDGWEKFVRENWRNRDLHASLAICGLGLGGESMEVFEASLELLRHAGKSQERIKKTVRGDPVTEEKWQELVLELGDVLHYLTRIAQLWGITLPQIMTDNQKKIASRRQAQVGYFAKDGAPK